MKKRHRIVVEIATILFSLIMVYPLLTVFLNTVKPLGEIVVNPFSLPQTLYLQNIRYVFLNMNYLKILFNTVAVSLIVVAITTLLSSMCGYKLTRQPGKASTIISLCLTSSMIIPFQSIMLSEVMIATTLGLKNSLIGYALIIIPLYAPFGVFMYQGFIKNIPISLEEAARIDGCGPVKLFFVIVFPLLKPATASVIVLYAVWIWNDYLLPSLILINKSVRTLTPTIAALFSTYNTRWDYALTALSFSLLPIIVFYLIMQKQFIAGVVSGAVKS